MQSKSNVNFAHTQKQNRLSVDIGEHLQNTQRQKKVAHINIIKMKNDKAMHKKWPTNEHTDAEAQYWQ